MERRRRSYARALSALLLGPGLLLLAMGWWAFLVAIREFVDTSRVDQLDYLKHSRSAAMTAVFVAFSAVLTILDQRTDVWQAGSVIARCVYLLAAYALAIIAFVAICSAIPYNPVFGDFDPVSYVAIPSIAVYGVLMLVLVVGRSVVMFAIQAVLCRRTVSRESVPDHEFSEEHE